MSKHPNDMTCEELLELIGDMTSLALDLAQQLRYAMGMKEEYLRKEVEKACKTAYRLAIDPYLGWEISKGNVQIVFIGDGFDVRHGSVEEVFGEVETSE